jgi:hypothetical protein
MIQDQDLKEIQAELILLHYQVYKVVVVVVVEKQVLVEMVVQVQVVQVETEFKSQLE